MEHCSTRGDNEAGRVASADWRRGRAPLPDPEWWREGRGVKEEVRGDPEWWREGRGVKQEARGWEGDGNSEKKGNAGYYGK